MQGTWVLVLGRGTKIPHAFMLQQKIPYDATKIPHAATKTQCNQIDKYLKKKKKDFEFLFLSSKTMR